MHFALTAQIRGNFGVDQLQQALTLVQQRHSLLRVRIALDQAEQPRFVEDSASILLRVVQRQSEHHSQQEVEQEIATPFVWSQAPLVCVVLVHSSNGAESSVSSASLSPETKLSLISRSRQEQTSVHAAICAAFLLALCHQNHPKPLQHLNCLSAINLRPYLPSVNQQDISLLITVGRTSHRFSADINLWDVARLVKHQLNHGTRQAICGNLLNSGMGIHPSQS